MSQPRASTYRDLLEVLQDRPRGLIFSEFLFNDELTASMTSERLGIPFTNASYHLRRLLADGVIEPTREVVAGFRTEKFYRIKPALLSLLLSRPDAMSQVYGEMSAEERRTVHCAWLAMAGNMLLRASEKYRQMAVPEFERLFDEERLMMLALGTMPREPLRQLLRIARAALPESWGEIGGKKQAEHPDYVVFAVLPDLLARS
jgi:DNA-binding Lrp family transcriptional regulator